MVLYVVCQRGTVFISWVKEHSWREKNSSGAISSCFSFEIAWCFSFHCLFTQNNFSSLSMEIQKRSDVRILNNESECEKCYAGKVCIQSYDCPWKGFFFLSHQEKECMFVWPETKTKSLLIKVSFLLTTIAISITMAVLHSPYHFYWPPWKCYGWWICGGKVCQKTPSVFSLSHMDILFHTQL